MRHATTRRRFLSTATGASAAVAASLAHSRRSEAAAGQGVRRLTVDGFVDLQVNGFAGVDFNDPKCTPDQVQQAAGAMRRTGVTQFLATLISAPADRFATCARTLLAAADPALAGIHMEGPYISPEDGARGAHRREDIAPPTMEDFARRQEAAEGHIRLVTVAPEVPGVLPLIERLVADGIRVAIGHSAASPAQIAEAVRAGATMSTHLGNGCAQLLPRHPNVIWEQLAADALTAGLIVDGHHLPGSTVKAMVRAKTPDRVVLVTDATTAAGQPPGEYMFGNLRVRLDATGRVAVPGQPNLAGSALSLDRAVGNTVQFTGLPLETVLAMVTTQPRAVMGLPPRGQITIEWEAAAHRLRVT